MKVLVGGNEYWIEFEYTTHIEIVCAVRPSPREMTTCHIRDASGGHTTDRPPVIASGVVIRYYLDQPNYELARKAALKKALQDLARKILSWYVQSDIQGAEPLSPRHRNRLFWDAYLNRKKAKGLAA